MAASSRNSRYHARARTAWSSVCSPYLRDFFGNEKRPEEIRVLDFGMGWGTYVQAVGALGCDVHGVEISDTRRTHVEAKDVDVYETVDEVAGEFDVVASHQTFEHIPEPDETLGSLCEVLAEDGLVHITTPSVTQQPTEERVLRKGPFQPLEHINGFTRDAMMELAARHDLSPVSLAPSLVPNPVSSGVKQRLRSVLHVVGLFWLYEYAAGENKLAPKQPEFFTPR